MRKIPLLALVLGLALTGPFCFAQSAGGGISIGINGSYEF